MNLTKSIIKGLVYNKEAALVRLNGDSELYCELQIIFLAELSKLVNSLHSSLSIGDLTQIRDAAHTLKGAGDNLGAERLSSFCLFVEQKCRKGESFQDVDDLREILSQIEAELRQI
jgi:HPt (histidine-containing phosphotransfer) domain-containing protein